MLVDPAVLPLDPNYIQHTIGMLREARQMQLSFVPILLSDALRARLTLPRRQLSGGEAVWPAFV